MTGIRASISRAVVRLKSSAVPLSMRFLYFSKPACRRSSVCRRSSRSVASFVTSASARSDSFSTLLSWFSPPPVTGNRVSFSLTALPLFQLENTVLLRLRNLVRFRLGNLAQRLTENLRNVRDRVDGALVVHARRP